MHLFNRKSFERADEGRRRVLRMAALATLFAARPGAYADELTRTPEQTWFSGAVLDAAGNPLRGALVEIWQCDAHGAYLHSRSGNAEKRDGHFQGYGRFLTGLSGEYGFRTIRPVSYPGRAPHIHVKVSRGDRHLLTSQCYVKGDPGNGRDGIFRSLSPVEAAAVVADFLPIEGSRIGELAARWDIVLGVTPEDG